MTMLRLLLSPQNPIPHLLIVMTVLICSTILALDHALNDAFIGIAGAALGTAGTALAVQRHLGQVNEALQDERNGVNGA